MFSLLENPLCVRSYNYEKSCNQIVFYIYAMKGYLENNKGFVERHKSKNNIVEKNRKFSNFFLRKKKFNLCFSLLKYIAKLS